MWRRVLQEVPAAKCFIIAAKSWHEATKNNVHELGVLWGQKFPQQSSSYFSFAAKSWHEAMENTLHALGVLWGHKFPQQCN